MKINHITKSYDKHLVLDFPEMELEQGKIYAVIGANGSGKSTLAKILAGSVSTDKKDVPLDKNISVGYMPQRSFAFRMTVEKNILLVCEDVQRAKRLMEMLQIQHLGKKMAHRLSGGETARMALARVMMKSYDLLILDEPTAAMDMETTSLAEELMISYKQENRGGLLVVTHSLQQARRIADEVIFLHKGILVEHGPKEKVLYTPVMEETKRFLEFYGV